MTLSRLRIEILPKINTSAAEAEAKKFSESIKKGMSGIKQIVSGAGPAAKKAQAAGQKGIAILDAVQSRVMGIYDTVMDLTGSAGQIADLAYQLGVTEEQLIGVERAFGLAGMGSQTMLHNMLDKFKLKVDQKEIDIGDRDMLSGFMDFIGSLASMDKQERDAVLEKTGFGKNNFEMSKLIGSYGGAHAGLGTSEQVATAQNQGAGIRGFAVLGDASEFRENDRERQLMSVYHNTQNTTDAHGRRYDVYSDALAAVDAKTAYLLNQAKDYKAGDFEGGMKIWMAVDTVQNIIPALLTGILTALIGPVEGGQKMDVGPFSVDKPEIFSRLENLGGELVSQLEKLSGVIEIMKGDPTPAPPVTVVIGNGGDL